MVSFSVGVSHKSTPERDASLARLQEKVHIDVLETTPGKSCVWGPLMWRKTLSHAIMHDNTHCLFMSDDCILLGDDFMAEIARMVEVMPNEVICLHSPHWKMKERYDEGWKWAMSHDACLNAYVFPVAELEEMLRFLAEDVEYEVLDFYPEDSQITLFTMATGRLIYHPLPSPVDHDTSIPSTWGADGEPNRRSAVVAQGPWQNGNAICIGLCYDNQHWLLRWYLTPEAQRKYRVVEKMYALDRLRNPRNQPEAKLNHE